LSTIISGHGGNRSGHTAAAFRLSRLLELVHPTPVFRVGYREKLRCGIEGFQSAQRGVVFLFVVIATLELDGKWLQEDKSIQYNGF
jgi:hypothetical protein